MEKFHFQRIKEHCNDMEDGCIFFSRMIWGWGIGVMGRNVSLLILPPYIFECKVLQSEAKFH